MPTVATAVLLLLHVPPLVASVIVVLVPWHMVTADGAIAAGAGFTVTVVVPTPDVHVPIVAVTEYTPAAVSGTLVMLGFCSVEENADGPVHE